MTRLPFGRRRPPAGDHLDDVRIRRIGWQLALVTGVMVSALLIILGLAVYASAQNALLQPVKKAIVDRARFEVGQRLSSRSQPGNSGRPPDQGQPPPSGIGLERSNNDGVFVSVISPNLACVRSTLGGPGGAYGRRVPDVAAARSVLRTGNAQLASFTYDGSPYLLYSDPIPGGGSGSKVAGVVQASLLENQYHADVEAIVQVLFLVGGLGLLASFLITGMVVQRALSPIRVSIKRQRDFVADAAHELRTPLSI
ncbi:MAG TPA: hypothetical protein VG815_08725, partial [Chloroflexota bacterium]|nr:hypothetical protein [Chloroflexota bacterium]